MQTELKDALGVPFASSPLMQLPMIEAMLPAGQEAGVLTISEKNLTPEHLVACGARANTAITGLPRNSVFAEMIFNNKNDIDIDACRKERLSQRRTACKFWTHDWSNRIRMHQLSALCA